MLESNTDPNIERRRTAQQPFRGVLVYFIGTVLLVGIAFGFFASVQYFSKPPLGYSEYSALFLDNGQVYFGKLQHLKRAYVTLTDVFYFGADDNVSLGDSDLSLVKLGSEVHGPTDEMKILREHILFVETLATHSRVVEAIKAHKN